MMRRYFYIANARPSGALGVFDPVALSVDFDEERATFPDTAVGAAVEKAQRLGWETCGLTLIRIETP